MLRPTLLILFWLSATLTGSSLASPAKDPDRDRDRLSDYQEVHKYGTDPKKKDSDGDGKPDGDWDERREYAYTIRTVVRVLKPCRPEVMSDDYQDARVRKSTDEWIELEVIHYPLNTNAEALAGDRRWKAAASRLKEFLRPGITTNWDRKLSDALVSELREKGVDAAKATDRELVENTARLLMGRAKYRYMFGTCTSAAIYLTTGLRALGIPTRMVLGIPFVDRGDPEQMAMVREGITHHEVRRDLLTRLGKLGGGFTSHTFNEVFVGGRWRRLNYRKLGQNTFGDGAMGLMTHIHTFNDLSEAGLTETWGVRYGKGLRDEVFRHGNPYRAMEVSDEFGVHCSVSNPEVSEPKLPTEVRITKAYWFHSADRPDYIDANRFKEDGNGHVLIHADIAFEQLKAVHKQLSTEFRFEAEGQPSVRAVGEWGYWNTECYMRIPAEEFAKMRPGVAYRLVPVNPESGPKWVVVGSVALTKPR